jgi:hypothetical protein
MVLNKRWSGLSPEIRKTLERRLRRGPPPELYLNHRAYSILDRLAWLKAQGCTFTFDVDAEIAALRVAVPSCTPEAAGGAADSREGRFGAVRTDTSFLQLTNVPIEKLIDTALAAHQRKHGYLETHDPYAGLCERRPVRVLAALIRAKEPSENVKIGWTQFLYAAARHNDNPALATLIARRLSQVPQFVFATLIAPVASWLEHAAKRFFQIDAESAWVLFDRLLETIERDPDAALPVKRTFSVERDWIDSALHSAAGHLTRVLLFDPTLDGITFLPIDWKTRANRLRALPDDHGRFCLVQLAHDLSWLFARDPVWTEGTILSVIDSGGVERDAALAGFFNNARIDGQTLFNRMKRTLLSLSMSEDGPGRRNEPILANLCITAWQQANDSGERWLSDEELRTVLVYCSIEMRTHVLWHIGQWTDIAEKLAFLKEVRPLQLAARSPAVTARLCTIAFNDEANFPRLVDAILPLITPYDGGRLMLSFGTNGENKVFERYPECVLALMSLVLPADASKWPYGTEGALQRLQNTSLLSQTLSMKNG